MLVLKAISALRYRDQRDRPDLTNPDSLALYLDSRFEQLRVSPIFSPLSSQISVTTQSITHCSAGLTLKSPHQQSYASLSLPQILTVVG